jgi:hypothetical protein
MNGAVKEIGDSRSWFVPPVGAAIVMLNLTISNNLLSVVYNRMPSNGL